MAILLLLLTIHNVARADLNDVDLKWKARGLQAQERLDKLGAKKDKTKFERCTAFLEAGYYLHAEPEAASKVKADVEKGRDYTLAIVTDFDVKNKVNAEKTISIVFDYDKSGASKGATLPAVPKGWAVSVGSNLNGFLLANQECGYVIYPDDPLQIKVLDRK